MLVVEFFPTVLVVKYVPTRLVVEGFPQALSDWPTIVNLASKCR